MKRFLVVIGIMLAFALAETLLNTVLGIKFPSIGAGALHDMLLMVNGAVLWQILNAKI